jgi:hypothetical protein
LGDLPAKGVHIGGHLAFLPREGREVAITADGSAKGNVDIGVQVFNLFLPPSEQSEDSIIYY